MSPPDCVECATRISARWWAEIEASGWDVAICFDCAMSMIKNADTIGDVWRIGARLGVEQETRPDWYGD